MCLRFEALALRATRWRASRQAADAGDDSPSHCFHIDDSSTHTDTRRKTGHLSLSHRLPGLSMTSADVTDWSEISHDSSESSLSGRCCVSNVGVWGEKKGKKNEKNEEN